MSLIASSSAGSIISWPDIEEDDIDAEAGAAAIIRVTILDAAEILSTGIPVSVGTNVRPFEGTVLISWS